MAAAPASLVHPSNQIKSNATLPAFQPPYPPTPPVNMYDRRFNVRPPGAVLAAEGLPYGYLKRGSVDDPASAHAGVGTPVQKRPRNASMAELHLPPGSTQPMQAPPRMVPPPLPSAPNLNIPPANTSPPHYPPGTMNDHYQPPRPLSQPTSLPPSMPSTPISTPSSVDKVARLTLENEALKELVAKLQSQNAGMSRQQTTAIMRLAKKEEEIQSLYIEIQDLTHRVHPEMDATKQRLMDPVFHLLFQEMKKQIEDKNKKIEDLTQELQVAQFSPHSLVGRKLIAKCRALQAENEELGRQLSFGRIEQLQVALSLEKRANTDLRKSLEESDTLLASLDTELETMQDTILNLRTRASFCEKNHCQASSSTVSYMSATLHRTKTSSEEQELGI
ncbi:hypothetical protein SeLEV6574_g02610 [Synchytrium endobioticum]|uniref:Uncharacterized protein n=1 Tax=Synchytrium endobioticum TaxID=286115 RepID=A0A507D7U5_9FUNG|nr:hypothetical protein SeLEV6574_g02610 [Synchytrium endobioticum]